MQKKIVENIYKDNNQKNTTSDYTVEYINNIIKKVNRLDLSPMEQLMYVYDIIRDVNNLQDDITLNNNISIILPELFNKVAKKLGFNSKINIIYEADEKYGHLRNMIEVVDNKYHIDGIYFFDTIYDIKDKDNYHAFARTFGEFLRIDGLNNVEMKNVENIFKKIYNSEEENITLIEIYTLNNLYKELYKDNNEISQNDDLIENIKDFIYKFYKPIAVQQFIKVLTNVRIQEYYENDKEFSLSTDKISEITYNSLKTSNDSIQAVFHNVLGGLKSNITDTIEKEKLDKQINRVVAAKTLKKVLDNKISQN